MMDPDRREASVDLTAEELGALLAGVTSLAEGEVDAAFFGTTIANGPAGLGG